MSRPGKHNAMAKKPDDRYTTSMCQRHHDLQHRLGEKRFWTMVGIDPFDLAEKLWTASGDAETAEQIIRSLHQK